MYRFLKLIIKQFKFFSMRVKDDISNLDSKNFLINLFVLINFIKLELKRTLEDK